jgi:predicted DNA-binding protein
MEDKKIEKKQSGVRLNADVLKRLKHLSIDLERPFNALMEEAAEDLLKKYAKKK